MLTHQQTETKPYHGCFLWVVLLLAARCVVMPFMPLADPTEGRYALIAREMVVSGDWITPRLWMDGQKVPFLGKPPLYFWCSAACMKLFGINEFAARLPGILSFAIMLLMVWAVLRRYTSEEIGWRAVFLILSSAVLFVASGVVIVDMMVTMAVTGALFSFFAFTRENNSSVRRRWSLLIFVMLALGFMTKGPVVIVLFGLPVILWAMWFKRWQMILAQEWYWGITLFAAITVPWFVLAEQRNPGFLRYFFVNENFLRFVVHEYGDKYGSGHEHIRGTAIWMMLAAAVPWSIYILYRLFEERQHLSFKSLLSYEGTSLFLCIFAANTLFWGMARQLLIAYLFPAVPAFAAWLSMLISRWPCLKAQTDPIFKKTSIVIGWCIILAILISIPLTAHHSTKYIIKKARTISGGKQYGLYFIRRIPYSAYFYDSSAVIAHPTESLEKSLNYDHENNPFFYITEKKYWTGMPDSYRQTVSVLAEGGKYILYDAPRKAR